MDNNMLQKGLVYEDESYWEFDLNENVNLAFERYLLNRYDPKLEQRKSVQKRRRSRARQINKSNKILSWYESKNIELDSMKKEDRKKAMKKKHNLRKNAKRNRQAKFEYNFPDDKLEEISGNSSLVTMFEELREKTVSTKTHVECNKILKVLESSSRNNGTIESLSIEEHKINMTFGFYNNQDKSNFIREVYA